MSSLPNRDILTWNWNKWRGADIFSIFGFDAGGGDGDGDGGGDGGGGGGGAADGRQTSSNNGSTNAAPMPPASSKAPVLASNVAPSIDGNGMPELTGHSGILLTGGAVAQGADNAGGAAAAVAAASLGAAADEKLKSLTERNNNDIVIGAKINLENSSTAKPSIRTPVNVSSSSSSTPPLSHSSNAVSAHGFPLLPSSSGSSPSSSTLNSSVPSSVSRSSSVESANFHPSSFPSTSSVASSFSRTPSQASSSSIFSSAIDSSPSFHSSSPAPSLYDAISSCPSTSFTPSLVSSSVYASSSSLHASISSSSSLSSSFSTLASTPSPSTSSLGQILPPSDLLPRSPRLRSHISPSNVHQYPTEKLVQDPISSLNEFGNASIEEKSATSSTFRSSASSGVSISTSEALTLNYFGNLDVDSAKRSKDATASAMTSISTRSAPAMKPANRLPESTTVAAATSSYATFKSNAVSVTSVTTTSNALPAVSSASAATQRKPLAAPLSTITSSASTTNAGSTVKPSSVPLAPAPPATAPAPHVFASATSADTFQRLQAILARHAATSSSASTTNAGSTVKPSSVPLAPAPPAPAPAPHVFASATAADTFQRLQEILARHDAASSSAAVASSSSLSNSTSSYSPASASVAANSYSILAASSSSSASSSIYSSSFNTASSSSATSKSNSLVVSSTPVVSSTISSSFSNSSSFSSFSSSNISTTNAFFATSSSYILPKATLSEHGEVESATEVVSAISSGGAAEKSDAKSENAVATPYSKTAKKDRQRRRLPRSERRLRKWRREQREKDATSSGSTISYDLLPEFMLEEILAYIPMADRCRASLVCQFWDEKISFSPRVWPTLHLTPSTFTRSKYNLYRKSGRGPATDRFYLCLQKKGKFFSHIIIDPNAEMHVLCEHLRVLKEYVASHTWEYNHSTAFPRLKTFEYTHTPVKLKADALTSRSRRRQAYGNLVGLEDETFETLKTIVNGLRGLKRLVLKNCFLGDLESLRLFMDAIVVGKSDSIEHLDVTNLTKTPIESLWFPIFVNLNTLVVTTNFLTETLLAEIGSSGVRNLVLDHDCYTSPFQNSLVEESWIALKQNNPNIRVTLLSTSGDQDVIHQDLAPVTSIIYKSERVGLDSMGLMSHVHDYCDTLEILAQEGLVKYRVARSFHDRVDMNLVMLVRSSSRLHTLALRERVSTATLLVLASSAKTLKRLYVRRNAVIKRSDWASRRNVQSVALSYEQTEKEIGKCLGDPNWKMLSDKEYKKLKFHWTDTVATKRDI